MVSKRGRDTSVDGGNECDRRIRQVVRLLSTAQREALRTGVCTLIAWQSLRKAGLSDDVARGTSLGWHCWLPVWSELGVSAREYLLAQHSHPEKVRARTKAKLHKTGPMPPKKLRERKSCIIKAATELFLEQGYEGTTDYEIAKRSGVAKNTVRKHIGDKKEIFREVVLERYASAVEVATPACSDDLMESLREAAIYCLRVGMAPDSLDFRRLMVAKSGHFLGLIAPLAAVRFDRFIGNLAQLFRQLVEQGLTPQLDHDESARLFADFIVGVSDVTAHFGGLSVVPSSEAIDAKVRLFMLGRFGETSMVV